MNNMSIGYKDEPSKKDLLGCEKYFKALKEYILSCETPATIAIQGGWGTGKSTAMNIIRDEIANDEHVIEFNTWMYSKTYGQSVIVPLLNKFVDEVNKIGKGSEKKDKDGKTYNDIFLDSEVVEKIKSGLKVLGLGVYAGIEKKGYANLLDHILSMAGNSQESEDVLAYKELDDLYVNLRKRLDFFGDDERFVVFVDDLDRLNPEDAVSLLEDMKNLMSLNHCVFIIAMDNDIVQKGLSKKYGENIEAQYARDFFDKIIQLPFALPVNQYDIEKYLTELNNNKKPEQLLEPEGISRISAFLDRIGETNPRTIKRLLNILSLYRNTNDEIYVRNTVECFVIILLQLRYRDVYADLVKRVKDYDYNLKPEEHIRFYLGCPKPDEGWFDNVINEKEKTHDGTDKDKEIKEKRITLLFEIKTIFKSDVFLLKRIIMATSVTGDGTSYTSKQEETEDVKTELLNYAETLFETRNGEWVSNVQVDQRGTSLIRDDFEIEIRTPDNKAEHVNLGFNCNGKLPFLEYDNGGSADLEKCKGKFALDIHNSTKGDLGKPYIILKSSSDKTTFIIREVSITHPESLVLAGKLLRQFKDYTDELYRKSKGE